MYKIPDSWLVIIQIAVIPVMILAFLFQKLIDFDSVLVTILIIYSLTQLLNCLSTIRVQNTILAHQILNVIGVTIVVLAIMMVYYHELITMKSILLIIAISLVFQLLSHFPGSKCHQESVIMIQTLQFNLLMCQTNSSEYLPHYIIMTNETVNFSLIFTVIGQKLYFKITSLSLFMLYIVKSPYIFQKVHNNILILFISLCCAGLVIMISADLAFHIFIVTIQKVDGLLEYFILDVLEVIGLWFLVLTSYVMIRVFIFWFTKVCHGINIYYNRLHRQIYLTYVRKSYHLLLLAVFYISQKNVALYLFCSSILIFFCCLVESLRGISKMTILKFFYDKTTKFVTDIEQQVALNHIQLFLSATIFPGFSLSVSPSRQFIRYAGLATVLIGDMFAAIIPQLYALFIDNRLVTWRLLGQLNLSYLPAFVNYIFPFLDEKKVIQNDLLSKDEFVPNIQIPVNSIGNPDLEVINFQQSKSFYLFGNRTIIGTCCCVVSVFIVMNGLLDCGYGVGSGVLSIIIGLFESFCVADNILLGFVFVTFAGFLQMRCYDKTQ